MHGQPIPQSFLEGRRFAFMDSSHGVKLLGSRRTFKQYGQSGKWVSDLFPNLAHCVDDIALMAEALTWARRFPCGVSGC